MKKIASTVDLAIEAGARDHYADAAYYTHSYRRRIDDVQFYVTLAGRTGGPILEYGIGNGRIALPLARHGHTVTGIELSEPMLADLTDRLAAEPPEVSRRVAVRRGDMRRLTLNQRFSLIICPFNAALHLYTRPDVEQFLARVRRHLKPAGLFVLDLSIPSLFDLCRDPERAYHMPRFRHPVTGDVVRYWEVFDYDPIRQVLFVTAHFSPRDDASKAWAVPLTHRQFFPQEWEALLHYNGFVVERVEGDFHGGPLNRDSDVMVWHARVRTSKEARIGNR